MNLLRSDRSSDALKVANLIDRIHLADFDRIDVAKPQPLKTLLSKADRDSLVGQRLVSTRAGTVDLHKIGRLQALTGTVADRKYPYCPSVFIRLIEDAVDMRLFAIEQLPQLSP